FILELAQERASCPGASSKGIENGHPQVPLGLFGREQGRELIADDFGWAGQVPQSDADLHRWVRPVVLCRISSRETVPAFAKRTIRHTVTGWSINAASLHALITRRNAAMKTGGRLKNAEFEKRWSWYVTYGFSALILGPISRGGVAVEESACLIADESKK